MSEKLCVLKKIGGGTLKETVLWTNSSPTSSMTQQYLSLSDSIANYDYIKVVIAVSTSDLTSTVTTIMDASEIISKGADYRNCFYGNPIGVNTIRLALGNSDSTKFGFSDCYQFATATTYNNTAIPLSISGLK